MILETIFVHIGGEKTGSTAIQRALYNSTPVLRKSGIALLNPLSAYQNYRLYSSIFWRCTSLEDYETAPELAYVRDGHRAPRVWRNSKALLNLYNSVESFPPHIKIGVLSNELFEATLRTQAQIDELKLTLSAIARNVVVLRYRRDPTSRIRSMYSTALRVGFNMTPYDFFRYKSADAFFVDDDIITRNWINAFGAHNIVTTDYDSLTHGVERDFFSLLGISYTGPTIQINQTALAMEARLLMAINKMSPSYEKDRPYFRVRLTGRILRRLVGLLFANRLAYSFLKKASFKFSEDLGRCPLKSQTTE